MARVGERSRHMCAAGGKREKGGYNEHLAEGCLMVHCLQSQRKEPGARGPPS